MSEVRHDRVAAAGAPAIAYSQVGTGPDVVLLHGALMTREDMVLALMGRLSERYRVTAFDRPGHGDSGRLGLTGSPWRQAAALRAAARTLGLERPVLVGHSYGGACAMAWAMEAPAESAGVVALAPIAFPELRLEHFLFAPRAGPVSGRFFNEMLGPAVDPMLLPALWKAMFKPQEIPDRFEALYPFDKPARRSQTEAEGEDVAMLIPGLMLSVANYPRCAVPVRVLAGDKDLVVNNRLHGAFMARLVPDGRYRELEGLGHMLHHFAQGSVAEAVDEVAARA